MKPEYLKFGFVFLLTILECSHSLSGNYKNGFHGSINKDKDMQQELTIPKPGLIFNLYQLDVVGHVGLWHLPKIKENVLIQHRA